MPRSGLRLFEVFVMASEATGTGVYALSYYSWLTSFEHVILTELLSEFGEPEIMGAGEDDEPEESEGILLHTLAPVTVDDGKETFPMRSRRLPAVVAEVAAQTQAATTLVEQAFVSMFPADIAGLIPYVTVRRYDEWGEPDLLDLFSVAVLSGRPNYSGRRVLFEGGILLEDLVADSPEELRKVHTGLHKRVDSYLWRGNP